MGSEAYTEAVARSVQQPLLVMQRPLDTSG